jgi:hypothetical protein
MSRVGELWNIARRSFEAGFSLLKVVKVTCNASSSRLQAMEISGKKTYSILRKDVPVGLVFISRQSWSRMLIPLGSLMLWHQTQLYFGEEDL